MLIKLKCLKCGEEFIEDNKYIWVCCNKEMERSLIENEVSQTIKPLGD